MRRFIKAILYGFLGIVWTLFGLVGLLILVLANELRIAGGDFARMGREDLLWPTIGIGVGVILVLFILLYGLRWLIKQPLKTLRNMSASELVALRDSDAPPPFSLYLRPFGFTDVLKFTAGASTPNLTQQVFATDKVEFEDVLFKGFENTSKLIALGRPGEHLGAGRVLSTEAAWQELAADLISKAEILVLVPSTRSGTLWEIEYIREQGYLSKTLIVLPQARVSYGYDPDKGRTHFKKAWRDVSKWREDADLALARVGLKVDAETNAGSVLRFSDSGDLIEQRKFMVEEMAGFWEAHQSLLRSEKQTISSEPKPDQL